MVRGIVIPANESDALEERDLDALADLQGAVGGYVQPIDLLAGTLTLYVNESGKAHGLPSNPRATALWWQLEPSARGRDMIVGDAALVPEPGERTVEELQGQRFWIEVQVVDAVGVWIRGDRIFDTWFDAACFALALGARFGFIVATRVMAG